MTVSRLLTAAVLVHAHHPRGSSFEARSAASDLPTAPTASCRFIRDLDKAAIYRTKGPIVFCGVCCVFVQVAKMMKLSALVVSLLVVVYVAGTTTAREVPGVSGKAALTAQLQVYALPCCVSEHKRNSFWSCRRRKDRSSTTSERRLQP